MTQPAVPDSADWQRRWTIDAGSVMIRPVTRRLAHDVLDDRPITRELEEGSLHDRLPQAMGIAILDIDSGAAAVLPAVWTKSPYPPGLSKNRHMDGKRILCGDRMKVPIAHQGRHEM